MADLVTSAHIPTTGFGSDDFSSREDAFWAWRDAIAVMFDVAIPSRHAIDTFDVSLHAYHPGPMLFGRVASVSQHFRRSASTIARGGVDHFLVQLYRRGGYRGEAGSRDVRVDAGDVCILDMAEPMHSIAQDFESISLVLPSRMLRPLLKSPDTAHGAVLDADSASGRILADHLSTLYELAPQLMLGEADTLLRGTAALIAGCFGPAADAHEAMAPELRAAAMVGIQKYIETHLACPELKPETVCKRFGLSRPTLYRLFEPHGGFSSYVRRRRLKRCFGDLASPQLLGRRVADIASHWGFFNETAFSRAFRRMFDISPRELRQAAAFLGGGHAPARTEESESELRRWLLTLRSA